MKTYELSKMTLLFVSSRSSVDRAPAGCAGGHGLDSCRVLRFSFVPRSCHVVVVTNVQQTKLYSFQNPSLGSIPNFF